MTEQKFPQLPERYDVIDKRNAESLYMTDAHRPFDVIQSIGSAGGERTMYNKFTDDEEIVEAGKAANRLVRFALAGNMSTAKRIQTPNIGDAAYGPKELSSDERFADARANMSRFLESIDVDPANVRVLRPDRNYLTPLQVVNIDADPTQYDGLEPAQLQGTGDMIYTYNPDIVFGVRPADCPIVVLSAETPKGRIYTMTHFAWEGAARQQVAAMKNELDALGADLSTATVYVTPGGQAESFPFVNTPFEPNKQYPNAEGLFVDVVSTKIDGHFSHSFSVDTPHFLYQGLLGIGLSQEQIFVDVTDTTSAKAGTASHSRSSRLDDDNTRDMVIVKLHADELTAH